MVERISAGRPDVLAQLVYVATVRYGDSEPITVVFAGHKAGGPVAVTNDAGLTELVTDPDRYGRLSPRWVRRYFGEEA